MLPFHEMEVVSVLVGNGSLSRKAQFALHCRSPQCLLRIRWLKRQEGSIFQMKPRPHIKEYGISFACFMFPQASFFCKDICSLLCCYFSFVFGSTGRLKKKGTVGYVSCDKYVSSLIPSKHKQLLATAREVSRHLKRRKTIIP